MVIGEKQIALGMYVEIGLQAQFVCRKVSLYRNNQRRGCTQRKVDVSISGLLGESLGESLE